MRRRHEDHSYPYLQQDDDADLAREIVSSTVDTDTNCIRAIDFYSSIAVKRIIMFMRILVTVWSLLKK
jgi:hypothetical protein